MDEVKKQLLRQHYPRVPPAAVHSGYHRGRRTLFGPVVWPDIISVHHLHLHVIVQPDFWLRLFKYGLVFAPHFMSLKNKLRRSL